MPLKNDTENELDINKKKPEEGSYMDHLAPKDKKKFENMMRRSGLTEDELLADAVSQYTKRKTIGKKERTKNYVLLEEDFNKMLALIPPEMKELRDELIKYKLKEDLLWQL